MRAEQATLCITQQLPVGRILQRFGARRIEPVVMLPRARVIDQVRQCRRARRRTRWGGLGIGVQGIDQGCACQARLQPFAVAHVLARNVRGDEYHQQGPRCQQPQRVDLSEQTGDAPRVERDTQIRARRRVMDGPMGARFKVNAMRQI